MQDYLPLTELAAALRAHAGRTITYSALYYHVRCGKIPTERMGRGLVVRRDAVPEIARTLGLKVEGGAESAAA